MTFLVSISRAADASVHDKWSRHANRLGMKTAFLPLSERFNVYSVSFYRAPTVRRTRNKVPVKLPFVANIVSVSRADVRRFVDLIRSRRRNSYDARCTSWYAFSAVTSSESACLRRRAKDNVRSRSPGVTYSVDLGDRRGEGKNSKSKIETSVGTREHGKQWVILFGERGSAYQRGKLCVPPGDAPLPLDLPRAYLQKVNRFPSRRNRRRNRSTFHPLSVYGESLFHRFVVPSTRRHPPSYPAPTSLTPSSSASLLSSLPPGDTLPSTLPQWMSRHESLSKNVVRTTRDLVLKTHQGSIPTFSDCNWGVVRESQITGDLCLSLLGK